MINQSATNRSADITFIVTYIIIFTLFTIYLTHDTYSKVKPPADTEPLVVTLMVFMMRVLFTTFVSMLYSAIALGVFAVPYYIYRFVKTNHNTEREFV